MPVAELVVTAVAPAVHVLHPASIQAPAIALAPYTNTQEHLVSTAFQQLAADYRYNYRYKRTGK